MSNTFVGAGPSVALFDRLPDAARDQLGVELAIIARTVLAAERSAVPVLTGALASGLAIELNLAALRVRIGLLGLKGTNRDLFYGVIVEGGRKAQTVVVERRRRVGGRLRTSNGRKRADDIVASYVLRVTARPAEPFVSSQAGLADSLVSEQLADFWDAAIARAGGTE